MLFLPVLSKIGFTTLFCHHWVLRHHQNIVAQKRLESSLPMLENLELREKIHDMLHATAPGKPATNTATDVASTPVQAPKKPASQGKVVAPPVAKTTAKPARKAAAKPAATVKAAATPKPVTTWRGAPPAKANAATKSAPAAAARKPKAK